jgi:hypothetical protein
MHYGAGASIDGTMDKLITSVVLGHRAAFVKMPGFKRMLLSYAMFGANMALTASCGNRDCFTNKTHNCKAYQVSLWLTLPQQVARIYKPCFASFAALLMLSFSRRSKHSILSLFFQC